MMRSRRHRARSPIQWLAHNPFLTMAILAGLSLAALSAQVGQEGIMSSVWLVLGVGFHIASAFLSTLLPDLEGWVSMALIAVVGLMPYLVLDAFWRRLKPG